MSDLSRIEQQFHTLCTELAGEFCSLRIVHSRSEYLSVRRGVVQPPHQNEDLGAMVTVFDKAGGAGYAATSDLSANGLRRALAQARAWAAASATHSLIDATMLDLDAARADYQSPVVKPWTSIGLAEKLDLLQQQSQRLHCDDRIQNWDASLWYGRDKVLYLSSQGSRIEQQFSYLLPGLSATAVGPGDAQTRTLGGHAYLRQGGLETLDSSGFYTAAPTLAEQALALLAAPDCPAETRDIVLAPDQMILQIHESIGHPLELDRILGDERNYAGTSFVTKDMFGSYRYGSELLNVTFDPSVSNEAAGYAFDDDGSRAERQYLIKDGLLLRPLGGQLSQCRAEMPGVAVSRANGWNRPPIDRMANLNLEPSPAKQTTLSDLIGQVERGVYMATNRSWSIDDARNKFQFGCEWGQLIENGELKGVVKNPSYRGISAEFWRSLAGVGGDDSVALLGTPYCGKGEPNQVIRVGHASPPCWFRHIAVFGGA